MHRFGSARNRHVHLHCCIIDGLFDPGEDGQVRFLHAPALTTDEMATITEPVRRRVLRWFARSGLLEPAEARDMLGWAHGGFSLDAAVRIAGQDRAGLERRLRYCARPPFAVFIRPLSVAELHTLHHYERPDGGHGQPWSPLAAIDAVLADWPADGHQPTRDISLAAAERDLLAVLEPILAGHDENPSGSGRSG